MPNCFFIKPPRIHPPCFVQLGRFGDLIQLFPAFKAVRDRTGQIPYVITSREYAEVFEGISYAHAVITNWQWWEGIPMAKRLADESYGGGTVLQWWLDNGIPEFSYPDLVKNPGGIILQCHGREWGVDIARWPDYGTSMWERAGFSPEEMRSLPLVFDRRNYQRELVLFNQVRGKAKLPMLLVNFSGQSSPFAAVPEMMNIIRKYAGNFQIVDLGLVHAERVFDLLGLYDRAAGLITIDTSTLHLANGSPIPYFAYTVGDHGCWNASVPKRKCLAEVKYANACKPDSIAMLEKFLTDLNDTRVQQIPSVRPGNAPAQSHRGAVLA